MKRALGLVLLLVSVGFAGCFGGSGGDGLEDPGSTGANGQNGQNGQGGTDGPTGQPPDPDGEKNGGEGTGCTSDDPKHHTHDNWGQLDTFVLYEGTVTIGDDIREQTEVTAQHVLLGQKVFTTEDDGSDDGAVDKTDIVFQGTKEILFRVEWSAATVPGVRFYFKHASTPDFLEFGPVGSGQDYVIPLKPRWADMAHQDAVSRWAFKLEAYDPSQGSAPVPVHTARGDVEVYMEIHRGDETYIDPPHPAFYCEGPVRYAGEINATVTQTAAMVTVDESTQVQQGPFEGHAPPAPHVVPMETTLLRAWLYYNYTGPAGGEQHALGLMFHGADTADYSSPQPAATGAGYAYYEIPVDGTMVDSPYAFTTDWQYGVYPILNGQENQGDFQGDFHIYLETVKE